MDSAAGNWVLQQFTFSTGTNNRPEVNRKRVDLNSPVNQLDQSDISRTFCSPTVLYSLFSSIHETFSRTHHMLGHVINISKLKKIEVIKISTIE